MVEMVRKKNILLVFIIVADIYIFLTHPLAEVIGGTFILFVGGLCGSCMSKKDKPESPDSNTEFQSRSSPMGLN